MAKNSKIGLWALLPLLLLSSCGKKNTYVGVYAYDLSDTFINSLQNKIIKDLDPYYEHGEYAEDAMSSQTLQNSQLINDIDSHRICAAVVNTVDRLAASALIEKAEKNNIPLVFINREPLKEDLQKNAWSVANCFYVGGNPNAEGLAQAEIANSLFGGQSSFALSAFDKNKDGKIQVASVKGEKGHQDAEARTSSCIDGLSASGYNFEIVESVYCNWKRSEAYTAAKTFSSKNIELLFANNDAMALGVIQALQESDASSGVPLSDFKNRHYPIIGCDGTIEGKAAVSYGYMTGTVLNDDTTQAALVVDVLRKTIDNISIPAYDSNVTFKDNYYYVAGPKITQ